MLSEPNDIYMLCVSGLSGLVALATIMRLALERHRLAKDDLSAEDRSLIWRLVIFVVFPILVALELRSTIVATELLGGSIDRWSYGLLWFEAVPTNLESDRLIIPALFCGELVLYLFALAILPSLLFRPHPFLATVVGYTVVWIFLLNLFIEPVLSCSGLAGNKWYLALTSGASDQHLPLIAVHLVLATTFLIIVRSDQTRMWFSQLTRPATSSRLQRAMTDRSLNPASAKTNCKLGLMYLRAGMRSKAGRQLRFMRKNFHNPVYSDFLEAIIFFEGRHYKRAGKLFLQLAANPDLLDNPRADLLAAAASCAFALGDFEDSIDLCQRALEFDVRCEIARAVRLDAYMKTGRTTQAANEVTSSIKMGISLDLENKLPLDVENTFLALNGLEQTGLEQINSDTAESRSYKEHEKIRNL